MPFVHVVFAVFQELVEEKQKALRDELAIWEAYLDKVIKQWYSYYHMEYFLYCWIMMTLRLMEAVMTLQWLIQFLG